MQLPHIDNKYLMNNLNCLTKGEVITENKLNTPNFDFANMNNDFTLSDDEQFDDGSILPETLKLI